MGFWGSNPKPQDDDSSKEFVSGSDWGREPEAVSVEDTLEDPFQDSMGIDDQWSGEGQTDDGSDWASTKQPAPIPAQRPAAGPIGTTPPAPPAGTQQQKEKGPPPLALGMTICAIDGGLNFIQGGVVGSAFGAFMGSSEAFQAGLRGGDLVRHVLYRVRASAFQFGSWVGAYRGVKCSMQTLRGKRDFLNGAVAGGVAGVIPVLQTRNPRVIIATGLGSAAFMGVLEGVEGLFSGGEQAAKS